MVLRKRPIYECLPFLDFLKPWLQENKAKDGMQESFRRMLSKKTGKVFKKHITKVQEMKD
jgi:hypothetical protein